ncbi:hypothetical protein EHS13_10460 [Paenibacillus psychroresistens]|uniref:Uncharacterized protein n=1 Tax=Paenibacillus psychroresistens TaxID=1778678 RepID=A0A6B8RI97_9BACL|nr:hypothetical protein [Paenibacillus psychroresistens]QGQ95282.1 hypothetical protein EHS13_10460 [Paenibacillus psychroresistens]
MFSLKVTVPKDIQADKPFNVEGVMVNDSGRSWEISHGADMFNYIIYDKNGEVVLQDSELRMVNAIGIMKLLKANEAYVYDGEGHV